MTESMIWCLVLLINVPSRFASGTEIYTRSVCQGDAVQLFRNVSFSNGSVVDIYINGDSQALIGTWNSLSKFSIMPEYKNKMFFDEFGTFWIRKIQRSDEQKYVLKKQTDTETTKNEVQIHVFVMVAPTKNCRPNIVPIDSALIASLESKECGHPFASVKWLEYPGISYVDKSTIKLPSGKESGTYYACVESPALKCVTDLKIPDYCSSFVVLANNNPTVSPDNKQVSPEMIGIIVVIILVSLVTVGIFITLVLRKKMLKEKSPLAYREHGEFVENQLCKVLREKSFLACGEQGKSCPASGNHVENESCTVLREKSSFLCDKRGTYFPASGNHVDNESCTVLKEKSFLACGEQEKYCPASGNNLDNESCTVLREKSFLACGEQGKYCPASGNNVDNESCIVIMKPISDVETKSVKYTKTKGSAALKQTKRKDRLQGSVDDSKMKLGQIEGTGGVIMPLMKLEDIDD